MTAAEPLEDGLPAPRRYWAIVSIGVAVAMTVLDGAIANVALPTIGRQFGAAPAETIWIVNAYQLAILVALLPLASLGEIVGYRRIHQGGLTIFVLASFGCALSHSLPVLVAARSLQGLGAAGVMSVNGALWRYTYPHAMLGRGIGINALVVSTSAAVGPSVASAILAVAPWPWLFGVNIPIGLAALAIASQALPANPLSQRRFDWLSAALNALTFGLVITAVDVLARAAAKLAGAVELAAGVLVGALLVLRERARPRPLVPIDLMRDLTFALSVATAVTCFAAQMLAFVALPFLFQLNLHKSQVATGLLLTPWPVTVAVMATISGWLADRFSTAILCAIGLAVLAAGLTSLVMMAPGESAVGICVRMVVCGAGFGLFLSPNNRMLLTSAPRERVGAAGGMMATARLVGQTIGATLTAIFLHLFAARGEVIALAVAAVFAVVAAGVSLLRTRTGGAGHTTRRHRERPSRLAQAPLIGRIFDIR